RWFRRRSSTPSSEGVPGAMAVVRRLLEGGGELDRETLFYLAEEEGIAPETASVALARWLRAGRVGKEGAEDGAEILRWRERSTPERSRPGPDPEEP
ncbi:MAG: hypothetical protein L3K09_06310, partial [Thermoplasmata archaeon]|nr:hypothetical protein [Thermoplasmata archaeon]